MKRPEVSRRPALPLLLVTAILANTGCESIRKYNNTRILAAAQRRAKGRLEALKLAVVFGSVATKVPSSRSLVVTRDEIIVDNVGYIASLWNTQSRHHPSAPFDPEILKLLRKWQVVTTLASGKVGNEDLANDRMVISSLLAALEKLVDLDDQLGQIFDRTAKDSVTVYFHPSLSSRLVEQVLYTAGMATHSKIYFAVAAPAGRGFVSTSAPGIGFYDADPSGNNRPCARPVVHMRSAGATMTLEASGELPEEYADLGATPAPGAKIVWPGRARDEPPPPSPAYGVVPAAMWKGRAVLSGGGTCPTFDTGPAGYDFDGLVALLTELDSMARPCDAVRLLPDVDIDWQTVARAMAVVQHGPAKRNVIMSISGRGDDLSGACAGGIRPGALGAQFENPREVQE